jgi:hypothetical protein
VTVEGENSRTCGEYPQRRPLVGILNFQYPRSCEKSTRRVLHEAEGERRPPHRKAEGKPRRGDSCHHAGGSQKSKEARWLSVEGPRVHATRNNFLLACKRRCSNIMV